MNFWWLLYGLGFLWLLFIRIRYFVDCAAASNEGKIWRSRRYSSLPIGSCEEKVPIRSGLAMTKPTFFPKILLNPELLLTAYCLLLNHELRRPPAHRC